MKWRRIVPIGVLLVAGGVALFWQGRPKPDATPQEPGVADVPELEDATGASGSGETDVRSAEPEGGRSNDMESLTVEVGEELEDADSTRCCVRVIDGRGQPHAGLSCEFHEAMRLSMVPPVSASSYTDRMGIADLSLPRRACGDRAILEIFWPDHSVLAGFRVTPGHVAVVTVVLPRGDSCVLGMVSSTGPTKRPLSKIRVTLRRHGEGSPLWDIMYMSRSDDRGDFFFVGLPAGEFVLSTVEGGGGDQLVHVDPGASVRADLFLQR